MAKKRILWMAAVLLMSLFILDPGLSQAGNKVWYEGTVTAPPWTDRYPRVEVNGITFTVAAEAGLYERYLERSGAYQESAISLGRVQTGQKVRLLIQGHRVFQLVIVR